MKRYSTSSVIRKIKIKATMRYQFMFTKMTIIKKTNNNKDWQRCREIRIFIHCLWKGKLIQPLWKTAWYFLQMLKRVTMWSSNSTPRYIPKRKQNICSNKNLFINLHSSIIHNRQNVKTTQSLSVDKQNIIYSIHRNIIV